MDTTTIDKTPLDGDAEARRTGAVWVAGTGAVLLIVAAAIFIAVSWDRLPDVAKMAAVGSLTAAFLLGGRLLRATLPATGGVLFHLGAFLLPVDLAGLNLRLGLDWRGLLLAEGMLAVAVFPALARWVGSGLLRWAARASVVVLAAGVAAETPAPLPILVAVAAVAALSCAWRYEAVVWATLAGVSPMVAMVAAGAPDLQPDSVVYVLGLAGPHAAVTSALAGGLAALVLGIEAHRRRDLRLAATAGLSLALGLGAAYVNADPGPVVDILALPALFVLVELVALQTGRDGFWRRPTHAVAALSEIGAAATGALAAVSLVMVAPGLDVTPGPAQDVAGAGALGLLAAGWLLAGWRRLPDLMPDRSSDDVGDQWAVPMVALHVVAAVAAGTGSALATAVALAAAAVVLTGSGSPLEHWLGALAATWAPITAAPSHPDVAPAFGVLAAIAVGTGAVADIRRSRDRGRRRSHTTLAGLAVMGAAAGWLGGATGDLAGAPAAVGFVITCAGLALVLDAGARPLGDMARWSTLGVCAVVPWLPPGARLAVAAAPVALLTVDALRLGSTRLAMGAAAAVQILTVHVALDSGLDVADTGLAVTMSAVMWVGLAAVADSRWQPPLAASGLAALATGTALAAAQPRALGTSLLVSGGLGLVAGATLRRHELMHLGWATATIGAWIHLAVAGAAAPEPYLVPVTVHLLAAGAQLRRRDPNLSSWVAYGPAIALLGGTALLQRVEGGPGWHALVAGAVGTVALVAGAWHRLAAPLLLGTALLGAVTIHESLPALAGVPTWAWLATAGAILLAAGVALERRGLTPAETGRRLVDVVAERFA